MLNVKHTKKYADKLYNEHPYKYSLFGLSKMLSEYKIPNAGIEILNKESGLKELEVPFIAYAGNEFVLVYEKIMRRYLICGKINRLILELIILKIFGRE